MSRIEDGFERRSEIESKEEYVQREAHPSIELSDKEYLNRQAPIYMIFNKPPLIPMTLDMPILEETIIEGKKNAESESQSPKRKSKKTNSKSNKPAMASI